MGLLVERVVKAILIPDKLLSVRVLILNTGQTKLNIRTLISDSDGQVTCITLSSSIRV
jgi:hypothetical protein